MALLCGGGNRDLWTDLLCVLPFFACFFPSLPYCSPVAVVEAGGLPETKAGNAAGAV